MIATVQIHTTTGEHLLSVQGYDLGPFVTLTLRDCSIDLTRDQARMAGDALRAAALTTTGEELLDFCDPWPRPYQVE